MQPSIYWIGGIHGDRLAIMSRPRGGDWLRGEIAQLQDEGVDVLVSLLPADEIDELDLAKEPAFCADRGIEYINFPIADRSVPADERAFLSLVRRLRSDLSNGSSVAIHCRAGIGRSALLAACILLGSEVSADRAFQLIAQARSCPVPDTEEQREWVEAFARDEPDRGIDFRPR